MCYRVNVGPTLNRTVKEASDKVSYEPCPEGYQAHAQQSHSRQRICLVQRSWCRKGFGMFQERKWGLGVGSKESSGARWGWNERPWSCSHVDLGKELEFSSKCSGRQAEDPGERVLRGLKTRQVSCLKQSWFGPSLPDPMGSWDHCCGLWQCPSASFLFELTNNKRAVEFSDLKSLSWHLSRAPGYVAGHSPSMTLKQKQEKRKPLGLLTKEMKVASDMALHHERTDSGRTWLTVVFV